MGNYKLTRAADRDFEEIFDFGIDRFGLEQAESYQRGMIRQFDRLTETPLIYPAVDYIRLGYRKSVYRSHSTYYRVDDSGIVIVRILGRQDLESAFSYDEF